MPSWVDGQTTINASASTSPPATASGEIGCYSGPRWLSSRPLPGLLRLAPLDATTASPAQPFCRTECDCSRGGHSPSRMRMPSRKAMSPEPQPALGLQQVSSHRGPSLIERDPDAVDISALHLRNQPFTKFLSRQVDGVAEVIPRDSEQPQARMLQVSPHDVILPARILVRQQNNSGSLMSAQNLVECVASCSFLARSFHFSGVSLGKPLPLPSATRCRERSRHEYSSWRYTRRMNTRRRNAWSGESISTRQPLSQSMPPSSKKRIHRSSSDHTQSGTPAAVRDSRCSSEPPLPAISLPAVAPKRHRAPPPTNSYWLRSRAAAQAPPGLYPAQSPTGTSVSLPGRQTRTSTPAQHRVNSVAPPNVRPGLPQVAKKLGVVAAGCR